MKTEIVPLSNSEKLIVDIMGKKYNYTIYRCKKCGVYARPKNSVDIKCPNCGNDAPIFKIKSIKKENE